MAIFDDIINNPNFGRLFRDNGNFARTFMMDYLPSLAGVDEVASQLQMAVDQTGNLAITIRDDARGVARVAGETNAEYFRRAVQQAQDPLSRVRRYAGRGGALASTQTGGAMNRRLDLLSRLYGVDFEVSSVNNQAGVDGVEVLREMFGDNAFIKVDPDTSTVIRAFQKDGKGVGFDELSNILGYEFDTGTKFKRWGALFNEAEAELVYDAQQRRVQMAVVSPAEYFKDDKVLSRQIRAHARKMMRTDPSLAFDDAVAKAYDTISDGALVVSESSLRRTSTQIVDQIRSLEKKLQNPAISPKDRNEITRRIAALRQQHEDMAGVARTGRSYNVRLGNAENVLTGEVVPYSKGEATAVTDEQFISLMRRLRPEMSDEEILSIDVLTTSNNLQPDVKMRKNARVSSMTLNLEPAPKRPLSNTLTTATFGGTINRDGYLQRSLNAELEQLTQEVADGRAGRRLMSFLDESRAQSLDGLTPAEVARVEESKSFAKKVQAFLRSGGDLRSDPTMTEKLLRQIDEEYFKRAKRTAAERATGLPRQYLFNGKMVDNLSGRFPMSAGARAHLAAGGFTREQYNTSEGLGRLGLGNGRFVVSPMDSIQTRMAFGGFDFDDSFYTMYQYDTKTKRLLNFTLRDPNQMGEYYIFDADIANDPKLDPQVRKLYKERERWMGELEKANKSGAKTKLSEGQVKWRIRRINSINDTLDNYFSGRPNLTGDLMGMESPDFIQKVDLQRQYGNTSADLGSMPAPNGSTVTRRSVRRYADSVRNSYRRLDPDDPAGVVSRLVSERQAAEGGVNLGSIFEFQGDNYSDYNRFFEMLGTKARKIEGTWTAAELYEEMARQAANNGTLGRAINHYTMIDSFIQSHLDYAGEAGVDPKIRKKLIELLQSNKLQRVDREALIDALVKDFDPEVVSAINSSLPQNAEKLGRIMKELNEFAAAEGIDFQAGFDPITFQERMGNEAELINAMKRAMGVDDEAAFLLSETDPKAYSSRLFQAQLDARAEQADRALKVVNETKEALSAKIGDDFSGEQIRKAQQIISDYEEARTLARNLDPEQMLRAAIDGDTSAIDAISGRAREIRTLNALSGASAGDIMAVARVLLDSGADLSVLDQAAGAVPDGLSVSDLFRRAVGQEEVFDAIRNEENLDNLLRTYFSSTDILDEPTFADTAPRVINEQAQFRMLRERIQMLYDGQSADERTMSQMRVNEFQDFLRGQESAPVYQAPEQVGEAASAMRREADEAADAMARDLPNRIRRFKIADMMGDTFTAKALRRGLVGLAAFAGVGITHRIVTGDRTVEQANPYPLIPQGSEYEKIASDLQFQQTPVVRNGSMTYEIRAYGNVDTSALSQAVRGVLGQGSTTIYNSSAPNLGISRGDSRSILDQRLN